MNLRRQVDACVDCGSSDLMAGPSGHAYTHRCRECYFKHEQQHAVQEWRQEYHDDENCLSGHAHTALAVVDAYNSGMEWDRIKPMMSMHTYARLTALGYPTQPPPTGRWERVVH